MNVQINCFCLGLMVSYPAIDFFFAERRLNVDTYKSPNSQKYFYLFFILRTFIIYTSLLRRVIIFILESAWHLQRVMTNFVA